METNWTGLGVEPTLQQVMADPVIHLVMRSDGIIAEDVWAAVETARRVRGPAAQAALDSESESEKVPRGEKSDHPLCRLSRLCEGILPFAGSTAALVLLVILGTL